MFTRMIDGAITPVPTGFLCGYSNINSGSVYFESLTKHTMLFQ